ncbi:MAG: hypothetical protein L0G94_10560 [Brachybacterium sp.]|uniref:hypothetical protein n=1 Tax=Brachybacterium sp. TaxID=1891286 RepID=UPI0026496F44|nr:hypothetical protein [Brachybacterium sp.]MDN5687097.1 hypothetical protein [Brachybacterium sp.]
MTFEVHVRGRKVITCVTRAEAEDWADVAGTDYAPAMIRDLTPEVDPRQQSIFDALEAL